MEFTLLRWPRKWAWFLWFVPSNPPFQNPAWFSIAWMFNYRVNYVKLSVMYIFPAWRQYYDQRGQYYCHWYLHYSTLTALWVISWYLYLYFHTHTHTHTYTHAHTYTLLLVLTHTHTHTHWNLSIKATHRGKSFDLCREFGCSQRLFSIVYCGRSFCSIHVSCCWE